jgi:outer membrane protein TolC
MKIFSVPKNYVCLCLLMTLLLAGCTVGPDFKKPAPPNVSRYTVTPVSQTGGATNVFGGAPQQWVEGIDIPGDWWTLFHSKPLNDLITRALTNNPDLKSAQAALAVAHENTLA